MTTERTLHTASLVEVTSPAPRDRWRIAYEADREAVVSQSPAWADAAAAVGWRDISRHYRFSDGREAVLPLVQHRGLRGPVMAASMPPAWGYGGVTAADLDETAVAAVLADLASLRVAMVHLRPNPLRSPLYEQATATGWHRIERRAHVLDLAPTPEEALARFAGSARRGVRAAQREGLEVEADSTGRLLHEHYHLFMNSVERWAERQHEPLALARWRARRRDSPLKFEAWARALGPSMRVLIARRDGVALASMIVLAETNAHHTRGAMDRKAMGGSRANELLMWHVIQDAVARGCRRLHLGESGGSASLSAAKEKFGAVGHDYTELRLERLPLTAADRAARNTAKRILRFRDT